MNRTIKPEYMEKARQWFIDNAHACIQEAESGDVYVNDLESYRASKLKDVEDYKNGVHDHTLAFRQRAFYLQTGESVAILP